MCEIFKHNVAIENYIVIMSRPFIITEYGRWIVGPDLTMDRYDASVGISSEEEGLTTPPRSGWDYRDSTDWVLDDTLLFLPGSYERLDIHII